MLVPPQVEQTQSRRATTKRKVPVKVMQSWYLVVCSALCVPSFIIFLQIFFDVVPFYPEAGAFIMVAGTISIINFFRFFVRYQEINQKIAHSWNETKKINKKDLRELVSKMIFVAGMTEISSLTGLLYFFATRDLIASFILCIPAIVVAILCRPMLPDAVLAKLK